MSAQYNEFNLNFEMVVLHECSVGQHVAPKSS